MTVAEMRREIYPVQPGRPRVVMGDDHSILMEGVEALLHPEFDVVATAADGQSLVDVVGKHHPDLVIVDVSLPVLSGIDAARLIHQEFPDAHIIFLSMHDDPAFVSQAFSVGAQAYVVKCGSAGDLLTAMRAAMRGETYVSPSLNCPVPTLTAPARPTPALTQRQRQIIQLVAEGKQNKEIATALSLSPRTVEFHKARIMNKLHIRTTAGLTRFAITHGLGRS